MPCATKAAQAASARRHYLKNTSKMKQRAREYTDAHRQRLRTVLYHLKSDQACADCQVRYPPWILDYHHVDPLSKDRNVADLIAVAVSIDRLLAEVAKCVLVCANCHRDRTYKKLVAGVRVELTMGGL